MTAVSEPIRAAVRRGDLGWLTGHLGAQDCTPAVVKLLVRHEDPLLRHLGLDLLGARIAEPGTAESEAAELAELLPTTLDDPPETAFLLAGLHQQLWRHVPQHRRPQWRAAGLPVRVQLAWLRAEVSHQPATVRHEPAGELLFQAVAGIAAADTDQLDELVGELAASGDRVLQGEALRLAREGLHTALLAPARAREHIGRLLASVGVAAAALQELAEPWAALAPLRRERLQPFLSAGVPSPAPEVIDAALAAATRHGHGDLLRDVVEDTAMPPRSRQRALQALGNLAGREDIRALVATAATDPLLLGGPVVACLRAMHRRGLFPAGGEAAAIVDLALADHTVSAAEAATIMFTCRRAAFDALVVEDADDARWPRRLALLVELARQGSGDLPVGDTIAGVLPATSRPEPFLAAIRALRHAPAEAAVVGALPQAPAAALHTLEAVGGQRTVAVLQEGLGLTPPGGAATAGVIAPHLRPVRHRALELLWHLTDDPDRRAAILARLDPRDVPRRIAADLGAPDRRELALLGADFDPDDPAAALLALARNGDAATLATIADLLLRIVADLAASWEPGATRPADAGRSDGPPAGEPAVPDEVVTAIHALGGRLHDRGRLRPFCLREAADAREAGHALVATMALDLLDRPGLSAGEQAVLLALLLRAPYAGTRARVHRLLRHRDRHVRKHVIALLAADATGEDAEALSASLIALTAARDGQTVRQALLALGHVRAHWAAPAVAACLDHPTMNIKKTAAAVLVHAGTPAVVPKLLFWLGHHDNPGLRATLIEALRAILGDAYAATVLAAAEQADDERPRRLLLDGLGGMLSARAVDALAQQGSPVTPALLALVAAGRVRLAAGTVEDLAAQLAAHGIATPASRTPTGGGPSGEDVDTLVRDGWHIETAQRIVDRHERQPEHLSADQLTRLRPMLADWLHLAGAEAATRPATLRLTLRLCPAPWPADEIVTFARAVRTLTAALSDATGDDRDRLLAVLEAVAPTLHAALALDVAARLRALAPTAAGHRSPLALLRRCGAVLTRADVEQALTAARLGPDPWAAEIATLRDAFAVTATPASGEAAAWRLRLEAAVRTPDALHDFRSRDDHTLPSRARLDALIDAFPSAHRDARSTMLDWMEALQPVDAPPWTLAEQAHQATPGPRAPHDGDLDQPRSAAQRVRLLAMLDAPTASRRDAAAAALREWPEPDTGRDVLHAFLYGRADVAINADLARVLTSIDETELRTIADPVRERAARVAFHLDPSDLHRLLPLLLEWWECGGPATRAAAERALRRAPEFADVLAESLRARLDAGAWGFLDLIAGWPLLRTPALDETRERLRAEGRDDLADKLTLVDGPLRHPDGADSDSARLSALRERPQPTPGHAMSVPSRHELLDLIRTGHTEQVRRALTRLAEAHEDDRPSRVRPTTDSDPELENLLAGLLHHPDARIRLHSHRIARKLLDRPTYLRHTAVLLDDPEPDVVRSAIDTLSHGAYKPAIPAIVGLLTHPHTAVRRTAATGLVHLGPSAAPALRHAAGHARPDRRHHYTTILDQIIERDTSTAKGLPSRRSGTVESRLGQD
ncbi:HEAT repeat domain-containing protein [Catellatospora sichuanensis]|uniref:HEAT repeat domain-containing protein n=1 Tax=Catellatospora sichuanensis TaxID=1969805 RepID=UPI0011824DFF|nr:HEAT repeat domain-containing protein [Catellatospora sichuanensis]